MIQDVSPPILPGDPLKFLTIDGNRESQIGISHKVGMRISHPGRKMALSTNHGGMEMSMTFIYTVTRTGRAVTVAAAGEIDVAAAGPFGTALCRLAETEATDHIEVDLSGLIFIDSTGTAALKRAYRTTLRHGCSLVVTNATGMVRRVLDLTGTPHDATRPVEDAAQGVPRGV